MTPAARIMLAWLGGAALITGYAVLANYTNQSAGNARLGALVSIAPLALAAVLLAWRSRPRLPMTGLLVLAGVALRLAWPLLKQHFGWVYWLEHESLQVLLFTTFARTLTAHQQPLCTQFAQIMYGELSPQHIRYSHRVTVVWTVFFGAMIAISTGLFFTYPIRVWSIFSNFVFLPLVIVLFVVEFMVRKSVLPEVAHSHIMDAARTYRDYAERSH